MYTISKFNPGYKYERSQESDCLLYMYGYFETRIALLWGLVIRVLGYKTRGPE